MAARSSVARALSVLGLLTGLASPASAQRSPFALPCGSGGPCIASVYFSANTFSPATQPTESGPYTYQVTLTSNGTTGGDVDIACTPSDPQLSCTAPNPASFHLNPGQSQVVSVGYQTRGIGTFQETITATTWPDVQGTGTTAPRTFQPITVTGIAIGTITAPVEGGQLVTGDTINVLFSSPSGIDANSLKLLIDGQDSTSRAVRTASRLYAVGLQIPGGIHRLASYGCTLTGRCDTVPAVQFTAVAPPTAWELDDSLPPGPANGGFSGALPGGLPLPADTARGCPVHVDDPEIRVTGPTSWFYQFSQTPALQGYIFLAAASYDTAFQVATALHDYKASENITCATPGRYVFLQDNQYDWSYWAIPRTPQTDSLWAVYPWGDRTGGFGPQAIAGGASTLSAAPGPTSAGGQRRPGAPGGPVVTPQIQNPGAIDPRTYRVWLNGTLIINNDQPTSSYVRKISSDLIGANYWVSASYPIVHHYDALNPASDNGGWNEMLASIADSTGHRAYIRSRFVQIKPPTIRPLALSALRDFTHLDQGECAAFGAFQCGGVLLTQAIPGFVTRDKDRSLHLVYRSSSQRAPTALPYRLFVSGFQATPDSLRVTPLVGGVADSSVHYMGAYTPPGAGSYDPALWPYTNEERVLGAELHAPASGDAVIRTVKAAVRSFYNNNTAFRDDTIAQEVVQLYVTDTASSRFGQGWTLAEQSRLIFGQSSQGAPAAIWLDGDGSYTIFRQVAGVWTAPVGETARLLDSLATPGLGARYVISPTNGATIGFAGSGWQAYTADLLGNRTRYFSTGTRLDSIADPAGPRVLFRYAAPGAPSVVSSIVLRGATGTAGDTARVASFAYDATGRRLVKIKIWRSTTKADSTLVGYLDSAPYGAYVDSVSDPRSNNAKPIWTTFSYDTLATYLPTGETHTQTCCSVLFQQYREAWRRAVPRVGRGRGGTQVPERLIYTNQLRGTHVNFAGWPTDFTVDRFGGPTWVRRISPPPVMTPDFLIVTYGGDDVRTITRDSVGRVTKIVHAPDSSAITDSLTYRFNAYDQLDRIIRNTLIYPVGVTSLDTISFVYDSVAALPVAGARCTRLVKTVDPLGSRDSVAYGTAGAAQCLPAKAIGIANDATLFTYGPLTAGDPAGVRPTSVRDPNGIVLSMQYDAGTWNSAVSTRAADNATSRAFYNSFGRPDSVLDPVGTRTFYRYDLSGRVMRAKTGTGTTAPTTWTFFNPAGLTDSTRVYGSNDGFSTGQDSVPATAVQATRYFYDRMGWLDSTVTPGGRHIRYGSRDGYGNPVWEYPGNGSYITRGYDWQGRPTAERTSAVGPDSRINNQPFADTKADSVYRSFNLTPGVTLDVGQKHSWSFDNKGRPAGMNDSVVVHARVYSRVGALVTDTVTLVDGLRVVRRFEYNRRGQRTLAADTVVLTGSGTLGRDRAGRIRYYYSTQTARLDSLVDSAVTTDSAVKRIARVKWVYDSGGRELQRSVLLGGTGGAELVTTTFYDAAGRISSLQTSRNGVWYQFSSPSYALNDELLSFSAIEPRASGGPPGFAEAYAFTYSPDGTRRLTRSDKTGALPQITYNWSYDVFGNRAREIIFAAAGSCQSNDTSFFGGDNVLQRRRDLGCVKSTNFWNDAAGNRLVSTDTAGTQYQGPSSILSYTAKQQLFFAMSPTAQVGTYDYNWHSYDGGGLRVLTQAKTGSQYTPAAPPSQTGATKTYYVYDGNDVALSVVKTGTSFWVRARYLVGGLDQPLAGRFATNSLGAARNLALIGDREGTTLAAMRTDGTQENQTVYFSRSPFGMLEGASGSGTDMDPQTGFAGASTPNQTGGFVYLRNRWYDPQTGRFLTQDPIGMAGGVNLYGYAGNNPVAYTDPFGLCKQEDRGNCTQADVGTSDVQSAQCPSPCGGVTFAGVSFSFAVGHGYGVAFGVYDSPAGNGLYYRASELDGVALSAQVEEGGGSYEAVKGVSSGQCVGGGPVGGVTYCRARNAGGVTETMSAGVGLTPANYTQETSTTHLSKPGPRPKGFDCSQPQPYNSVCSR